MTRNEFEQKYLNKMVKIVLVDNKTYIGKLFSTEEYMKKTIFLDMGDYYFVGNDINDNSLRFRKSHIKSIKLVEGSDCNEIRSVETY